MNMLPVMNICEFVDALGGNADAAAVFGVTAPAVCNWKAANRLPERLHLKALRIAAKRGIAFDPEVVADKTVTA